MKLGPSFLKQADPELAVSASRKRWFPIGLDREVIIDNNWRILPVQEELHHVDARSIGFLRHKHVHDPARHLRERAQSGQEVAIAQATLMHVIGFNTILKDVHRVVDFTRSLPCERVIGMRVNLVDRSIV